MATYNSYNENDKKKPRYDYDFTRKIAKLFHQDPLYVICSLNEYLEEYPKDYSAYLSIATALVSIGRISKAKEIIDYIEPIVLSDSRYLNKNEKGYNEFNKTLVILKLKIAFFSYDYITALRIIETNREIVEKNDFETIGFLQFYCKARLGMITHDSEKVDTYRRKQVVDYSEERFLEHIQKHIDGYDGEETSPSRFYKNFEFQKVYDEVKKYIPNQIANHKSFAEDAYYFKYDDCGHFENINRNFFKVVAYSGTDNFITMCPAKWDNGIHYIDLNYLKSKETQEDKWSSRVDAFNKKYNR